LARDDTAEREDFRMGTLTTEMKKLIDEQKLGFVATVCDDGTPNLSPKGTMLVLDDDHIIFGEIRSPNTVHNLERRPHMEINFVDPFARKGFRFKGAATYMAAGTPEFESLHGRFEQWGDLAKTIRGIVKLKVETALPLSSPAYDIGATEAELRRHWREYFLGLQAELESA
jgi:hypothetical protein